MMTVSPKHDDWFDFSVQRKNSSATNKESNLHGATGLRHVFFNVGTCCAHALTLFTVFLWRVTV